MRIVFMGTPNFAAALLASLAAWEGGDVVAVYAQPDRPAGRGNKLREAATKTLARRLGIPVFQPVHFKAKEDRAALAALQPDVLVVAAYGLLLPQSVLDIPVLGAYNLHASLLPRLRGAAPVQRALMNGDTLTGVTVMRMEAGLDTGPILLQQALRIDADDTAGVLFDLLADHGASLMRGALGMLAERRAAFIPQNGEAATYAPKIRPDEEYVDWSRGAAEVHNQIRGLFPLPGARALLRIPQRDDLPLRLEPGVVEAASSPMSSMSPTAPMSPISSDAGDSPAGTILEYRDQSLVVACGEGRYRLTRLRPAGKDSMSAADFRNGRLRGLHPPYGVLGRA